MYVVCSVCQLKLLCSAKPLGENLSHNLHLHRTTEQTSLLSSRVHALNNITKHAVRIMAVLSWKMRCASEENYASPKIRSVSEETSFCLFSCTLIISAVQEV